MVSPGEGDPGRRSLRATSYDMTSSYRQTGFLQAPSTQLSFWDHRSSANWGLSCMLSLSTFRSSRHERSFWNGYYLTYHTYTNRSVDSPTCVSQFLKWLLRWITRKIANDVRLDSWFFLKIPVLVHIRDLLRYTTCIHNVIPIQVQFLICLGFPIHFLACFNTPNLLFLTRMASIQVTVS